MYPYGYHDPDRGPLGSPPGWFCFVVVAVAVLLACLIVL